VLTHGTEKIADVKLTGRLYARQDSQANLLNIKKSKASEKAQIKTTQTTPIKVTRPGPNVKRLEFKCLLQMKSGIVIEKTRAHDTRP